MEELNNRQMVLLTSFVSFVVSIATGIITVAMLQEAPPTLTQTVNRVVEHTIERVVTGTSTPVSTPGSTITNITKETIFAKEDDLVVSAVEKNQPRVVQIFKGEYATSSQPQTIGFIVSRDGLIATEPKSLLGEATPNPKENYTVLVNGKKYNAVPMGGQGADLPVYFLKISDLSASDTLDSVTYGRTDDPKIAQTVVVLGGNDGTGVFKTTLSRLRFAKGTGTSSPAQYLVGIETLPKIPEQNAGALVVNLDGQVVGIVTTENTDPSKYIIYPTSRILELVGAKGQAKSDPTDKTSV